MQKLLAKDTGSRTREDGSLGVGIMLSGGSGNLFKGNVINNNERGGLRIHGHYDKGSFDARVNRAANNKIYHNGHCGLFIAIGTEGSELEENEVWGNQFGVCAVKTHLDQFTDNIIKDNKDYGIVISKLRNTMINGNDILKNKVGIYILKESRTSKARCNRIEGNDKYGALNETVIDFDAKYNWWGHPSGPARPSEDPGNGKGDRVSDYVLYRRWLPVPPDKSPFCPIDGKPGPVLPKPKEAIGFHVESFRALPNPANAGDSVKFEAKGEGVVRTKVEVFSANGAKLFDSGFEQGSTVNWDLTTSTGETLSNGIYLFTITADSGAKTVTSKIQKLLVIK